MQITKDTLTINVLPYITEEDFQKLYDKVDPIPLKKPVTSMTVGEFILASTDENWIKGNILSEEYLLIAIGRLKQFKNEMENIDKYLNLNEIKETSEEKQAKVGVVFPTMAEGMLLETAEFFHLHSLDEAENVPLSSYLILHKKKTAEALFERNLHRQYEAKSKRKERSRK